MNYRYLHSSSLHKTQHPQRRGQQQEDLLRIGVSSHQQHGSLYINIYLYKTRTRIIHTVTLIFQNKKNSHCTEKNYYHLAGPARLLEATVRMWPYRLDQRNERVLANQQNNTVNVHTITVLKLYSNFHLLDYCTVANIIQYRWYHIIIRYLILHHFEVQEGSGGGCQGTARECGPGGWFYG